jgi:hypothetical protein
MGAPQSGALGDRAESILRRQSRLEGERANWEGHWAEAAERVLPRQRDFQGARRAGGEKLSDKVFDSTAPLALEKFAAAMESMLTPRNERWHELSLGHMTGQRAAEDWPQAVKEYLYAVTSVLFRLRYAPSANFASQAQENHWLLAGLASLVFGLLAWMAVQLYALEPLRVAAAARGGGVQAGGTAAASSRPER